MCAVTSAILFTTGALLAFALVSQRLATTPITGPIVFVALGLLAVRELRHPGTSIN